MGLVDPCLGMIMARHRRHLVNMIAFALTIIACMMIAGIVYAHA